MASIHYAQELRAIARTMEVFEGERGEDVGVGMVKEIADFIERISATMTLEDCRDVLNEHRYLFDIRPIDGQAWEISDGVLFNGFDTLTPWEATAIARAFMLEKEVGER